MLLTGFEPASERPQTHAGWLLCFCLRKCRSRCAVLIGILFCVRALRVCITAKRVPSFVLSFLPSFPPAAVFHVPVLLSYYQLSLYTFRKAAVPIVQEAAWHHGRSVCTTAQNIVPIGIPSPDRPARTAVRTAYAIRTHNLYSIFLN
jgi:hypothetical protein